MELNKYVHRIVSLRKLVSLAIKISEEKLREDDATLMEIFLEIMFVINGELKHGTQLGSPIN